MILNGITIYTEVRKKKFYAHPPVVGMGPSWPSIEHGHSGITAHLETTIFNVCKTLNLGVSVSYTHLTLPTILLV